MLFIQLKQRKHGILNVKWCTKWQIKSCRYMIIITFYQYTSNAMFRSIILYFFMDYISTIIQIAFIFPLPSIRSYNSHCLPMNSCESKKSFKEKVDSDNNWKSEWFWSDIIFEGYHQISKKIFDFCGKPSKFLIKSCQFSFCIFCLIRK